MTKCIAILATMDTKGAECAYLREEVEKLGGQTLLIDIGVVGVTSIAVDINKEEVASQGGRSMAELLENPSREVASEVMVKGSIALVKTLITENKIHALISLGGTQGTNNGCMIMQDLPYGFPKIMLSTMASGDTSNFVGIKDITMMFSVSDILGLNPFSRCILSNTAGAAYGMAQASQQIEFSSGKTVIGISNLGVLTSGTMKAIDLLNERGYESIVFHAIGSGGRAMEQMMREGIIKAVFDFGLGDIADSVYEGIRAADDTRLTVAGKLGLPQVVVPGGIDHLGIMLDEPNTVPEKYKDHLYSYHNPVIFVPRTNSEEITTIMQEIANRLEHSKRKTVFMLPTRGVSSYSAKGGALYDPVSDEALHQAVRDLLPEPIKLIEMENNAEDEAFVRKAVDTLIDLIEDQDK
ncbi:MAG: Tm-1-like ATP-binding domain-containing protein [Deltaproteobacteria bacterium]|nr:Tm-1-like ATP-binding domain-containing protein [Deltaproteobacteria bacterium]MBT6502684.1 Tm-1-like ATP-binding domain-containing protein [Deltaproteobacteria bacterium]MBT7715780.1 Tm-1-like ATP-binding domain-containing protein [Deltaproteobacteria bacterium]